MKKLLLALVLLLPLPAHAQSTKAALTTEINTNYATGVPGGITAATLRTTSLDILNSIMPTAPVVNLNLACFDGITGLLKDCGSAPTPNAITALTGDITATGPGSVAATLATVNAGIGTFGSATAAPAITVNAKGLITAATANTVTPAVGSITGLGTGVATALGTNIGTAGSPVINGGALGTPSSGTATNLTGTAAGLTAGTVTTNANLTGPVTSVGNATAIANNQITRAMEAQGVARSVIGVTGNATANVADIQGTANQALVVNSGGTALTFGQVNLATGTGVTGTLPVANGGTGDTGTAWTAYTLAPTCGTATFTINSARQKTMGKTVWFNIDLTITAIGSCTTLLTINLPVTSQAGAGFAGREMVSTGYGVNCGFTGSATTANCSPSNIATVVFAVNNRLTMSGVMESQ